MSKKGSEQKQEYSDVQLYNMAIELLDNFSTYLASNIMLQQQFKEAFHEDPSAFIEGRRLSAIFDEKAQKTRSAQEALDKYKSDGFAALDKVMEFNAKACGIQTLQSMIPQESRCIAAQRGFARNNASTLAKLFAPSTL